MLDWKLGQNDTLEKIEKELRRRMLEDYNEGAEEDEVAQGCMATMIYFYKTTKGEITMTPGEISIYCIGFAFVCMGIAQLVIIFKK